MLQQVPSIRLPLLPLRDVVVYPHSTTPLFVGRDKSIAALNEAMSKDKKILVVTQKISTEDDPQANALHIHGTLSNIIQMLKLPDGTVKVLIEGTERIKIIEIEDTNGYFTASYEKHLSLKLQDQEASTIKQLALDKFQQYANLSKKISTETINTINTTKDAELLADTLANNLPLSLNQKQKMLELDVLIDRFELLLVLMESEIELFDIGQNIRTRVKKQMEKSQKEYFLNEQMKAIQKELGETDEDDDLFQLEEKIISAGMTKDALVKAKSELKKLKAMSPMSAEASVLRGYIDWLICVPWKKRTKVRHDLKRAERILNEDHYGLSDVKERILEFLAVQKRVKALKGPVLCLVGPPGVGKTSLGESIAKATGRKYARMSLGGVRDEAEIRGHRRTYIGSLPGKLLQKLSKVKVKNPLFLLDEIEKMGTDHRGDPSSAMLEVLDPEQNNKFNDHYLEVDYDLSEVMFICTANTMDIPAPLLDRMEIIRISGYTEDEKLNIASKYLLPKQLKKNGLLKKELSIEEETIINIIRHYTKEAGVRGLEKQLAKLCRKIVIKNTRKETHDSFLVTSNNLEELLGVKKYDFGRVDEKSQIGQVTGLAWTQMGGELLTIETSAVTGSGKLIKTGSLGDVMQESIQAAMTVVRNRAQSLGIHQDFHNKLDFHIHVPEGATPKDGPSAGVGMCTVIASALTGIPVRGNIAMTGEITLRGEVLKIGGLKEKLLAAHRGGITKVIIPHENEHELIEIPENIKADIEIISVRSIDEVFDTALLTKPLALSDEEYNKVIKDGLNKKIIPEARANTH
jgi:ATP-dependent Lon protease